jgi:peptide/nickel transport system substrate-binding protein
LRLSGSRAVGLRSRVGTIISGTTDTVTNIDPAGNYDYGSYAADINIFEYLYQARNGATVVPSLATKCSPVGTVRTWRCNLRRGVKFHDGSGFDSADVKYSFDRVIKINDPSGISLLLSNLKSVVTNGPYAVTLPMSGSGSA